MLMFSLLWYECVCGWLNKALVHSCEIVAYSKNSMQTKYFSNHHGSLWICALWMTWSRDLPTLKFRPGILWIPEMKRAEKSAGKPCSPATFSHTNPFNIPEILKTAAKFNISMLQYLKLDSPSYFFLLFSFLVFTKCQALNLRVGRSRDQALHGGEQYLEGLAVSDTFFFKHIKLLKIHASTKIPNHQEE